MERPFERLELGGEHWWEVYTLVTRGMRKRFRQGAMSAVKGNLQMNGNTNLSDPDQVKAALLANATLLDLNAIDDAYLIIGTKAWSWPEPVSLEAIDNLPDEVVAKVLARMQVLYAEPSEETQKKGIATS